MTAALLCPVSGCHDGQGRPRELRDGRPVCGPCRTRALNALDDLPALYVELRTSDHAIAVAGERVSGSGDPDLLNLDRRVAATDMCRTLLLWEDVARGLGRMPARTAGPVREGWAVQHAVTVLAGSTVLWNHPFHAPDLAGQMLALKRRAWTLLGWGGTRIFISIPCPHCELKALVRHSGSSEFVACLHCHALWDEAGYRRLARIVLDEDERRRKEHADA